MRRRLSGVLSAVVLGCGSLAVWAPAVSAATVNGMSVTQLARQVQLVRVSFGRPGLPTLAAAGYGGILYNGQAGASQGPAIRSADAAVQAAARATPAKVAFISTDEEGGGVDRLAAVIGALPWERDIPGAYSPAAYQSLVARHSAAMAGLGFNLDLAPVIDTAAASQAIGDEGLRTFSDTPATVSTYGRAAVAGLRQGHVLVVVKHFPGLGHVDGNTDDGPASTPPLSSLESADLIPFRSLVADGVGSVMMSNAMVPGLTGTTPASVSPAAYGYLTGTLHFTGMVMTDSLAAGSLSQAGYSEASASVAALSAGADLVLEDSADASAVTSAIVSAVSSGRLPLSRLEDAVEHVLHEKGITVMVSTPSRDAVIVNSRPVVTRSAIRPRGEAR